MIDPEVRRGQLEKWIKLGFIGVGCAIAGPLAFYALEGLIAIAAFSLAALLLWSFAPVVSTWIANKKIQALIAVIEANPIETMQNLLIEKTAEFDRQENAVTEFETQFRNVSDMVEGLKRTDPEEATSYVEMRDKMDEGLKELRKEQSAAQQELKNAENAVAKMQRIWKVACAMNEALSTQADAQQKVFAKMKQDVAVDAVRTNLNRAFARLNTAVEHRKNAAMFTTTTPPAALPEAVEGEVIDLTNLKQKALIGRKQ